MPVLDWIGKDKVVNHHLDVPYHVLDRKYSFDKDGIHKEDNGSENMIIHGDNLLALKSLLPQYEGRIDCIYIDPPYNTGNENWVYNDNVNDPKIRKWLGQVVGVEGEDLSRHDKWLCMMYPRLRLLQKLLSPDGVMAISIGYQELNNLMLLCHDIFADRQTMAITVQTSGGKPNGCFNITNEYIILIAPYDFSLNELGSSKNEYSSPYHGMNLATFNQEQRPNQFYPIFIDNKGHICGVGKTLQERMDDGTYNGAPKLFQADYDEAPTGTVAVWPFTQKGDPCVWRLIPQRLLKDWEKGYIKVVPQSNKNNQNKYTVQYLSEGIIYKIEAREFQIVKNADTSTIEVLDYKTSGAKIPTVLTNKLYYTARGKEEIRNIFGDKSVFTYPKPSKLIEDLLQYITDKNAIILDSFAGSGTTAHAVLNLNKQDGGHRKFIAIEMMDYADSITAERIKRVITGYSKDEESVLYDEEITAKNLTNGAELLDKAKQVVKDAKESAEYSTVKQPKIEDGHLRVVAIKKAKDQEPGIPGSFSYYELGEPLLKDGLLNENVGTDKIREYVYFTETKQKISSAKDEEPYFLGQYVGNAYYFYYNRDCLTTLDREFLHTVKTKSEGYVIYADLCTLSERELERHHITFKKIPRDISRL